MRPLPVKCDLLVIGSGIAGLRAAIGAAEAGWSVVVATKDKVRESNTEYAQGGIAVAMAEGDSPALHLADTLEAGDGLCDEEAVRVLVEDGPERVKELLAWGACFDTDASGLHYTREAAHNRNRILHAHGDSTGRELARALQERARGSPRVALLPYHLALDLIILDGRCRGAWLLDETAGKLLAVSSRAVLMATGGIGRLYQESTNPPIATGDGLGIALRAGAVVSNLEFIQFHPTALFLKDVPRFLLSESMRGEGALLRNAGGERFMEKYHPDAELAPRDVVSRALVAEMRATRGGVSLDLTHLPAGFAERRFPTIHQTLLQYGVDMRQSPIPVHPAAHYAMGGIATDRDGRSTLPGLLAAGEVACTGVHGANRLASNSLLEGLVFGSRAALAAISDKPPPPLESPLPAPSLPEELHLGSVNGLRRQVAAILWEGVGILRSATSLVSAREELASVRAQLKGTAHRRALETLNMAEAGDAIAISAEYRTESRGAHFREDFPERDDARWRRPTRLVKAAGEYRFLEADHARTSL